MFKTVYSEKKCLEYKAKPYSTATFLFYLSWTINILVPFVLIYRSEGIWIKHGTFAEQPSINFKHEFILILDKLRPTSEKVFYSTFNNLNQAFDGSMIRVPTVTNFEVDNNGDGINDEFLVDITVPTKLDEEIVGVDLLLFFDYQLSSKIRLQMESLAIFSHKSFSSGSSVSFVGDLTFRQKELVGSKGYDHRYSKPILNDDEVSIEEFSMEKVFLAYFKRNFTTVIREGTSIVTWNVGRDPREFFTLKVNLSYPLDLIHYRPGFWYVIKWAWIQYLSVFVVFYYIIQKIKNIIYSNQILPTMVVESPKMFLDNSMDEYK